MTTPTIIWTEALTIAARDLGRATYAYDCTIPERAREMSAMRAGQTLTPIQLDCVAMLRSRMHERTPAEDAFNHAWGAAWDAAKAKIQPGDIMGSYDPALKPRPGETLATAPAPSFTGEDWDGADPMTIKRDGFTLTAKTVTDDNPEKPWDREDGHGPVRLVKAGEEKREGERYLTWGRDRWAYDWDGALTQAWGDNDGDHAQAESHVAADFDRLQRFTDGHWGYVGVCVVVYRNGHQLTGDYGHALWGIESDAGAYFAQVADELTGEALDEARQILADLIEGDGA